MMPQTKLDSDYMKVVGSGNLEVQQRMVDEALLDTDIIPTNLKRAFKSFWNAEGKINEAWNNPAQNAAKTRAAAKLTNQLDVQFENDMEASIRFWRNINELRRPVTYDNSGAVIPLSKRFDVGSGDIR